MHSIFWQSQCELVREIQSKYPQVTWVEKDEKIPTLLELIAEKAREVSASERKQLVTMEPGWSENTVKALLGEDTTAPEDLAYAILVQLFPGSQKLFLDSLAQSVVTLQSVSRGRSLVMKIRSDEEVKSYFVKIAHADAIERETANFKKYIDGNLFGRFHPILTGSVIFWDLGGVSTASWTTAAIT